MDTVPADYAPTHALQKAILNPTGLTEVNLGISPAHSLSGTVQEITPEGGIRPSLGIRVYLTKGERREDIERFRYWQEWQLLSRRPETGAI